MKNNKEMTKEKDEILKMVIESFIEDGVPVGSQALVQRYNLSMSSSKVRYIMNDLEELGFLTKEHTSSGRVPSTEGYSYYAKNLIPHDESILRKKINELFAKRWVNIDLTVDEAANVISDIAGITLVTTTSNENTVLKTIQFVPLSDSKGTVVLVTSDGDVTSKTLDFEKSKIDTDDLRIAIRIFRERLTNIPILKLKSTAESLSPILSASIKNYEYLLKNFVDNIFDFEIKNCNIVYGKDKIILADDISRPDLNRILNLIETKSIWQTIEAEFNEEENIKIAIHDDNSTFITKKLKYDNKIKEISLVGTKRMDYQKSLTALQMFEDLITNKNDEKNENQD
ncbi:heat-inducible transcriptional repressor HrcA [Mycoplasma sp. Mirounga ES2805-ORL]|uniref:heat-inducible transcriptional repressor HrcA n=1 Tax=Mycoplasma sp. Mirounga ES2805-ORL TaxID=754514 RepID=UPI00197C093C|nr:heat-inducible transcriptional repressor HrcA [Mycoplasma sp. Mirounga ES2805-ORL]QSF13977.1 heat-inducible transcriptional repressor HrcA [Mycoplasma sp. Mirounga ES2805-ORL]